MNNPKDLISYYDYQVALKESNYVTTVEDAIYKSAFVFLGKRQTWRLILRLIRSMI